ncbi:hypothetical protein AnigIFM63309_008416 [Aspergillus niger]|nr:hypothetical protein AnigIFM63309_008416 [Aspergillus niger]
MTNGPLLSPTYNPSPTPAVEYGPFNTPKYGCVDEVHDAIAAHGNALGWAIKQDEQYARQAVRIMDAWSSTLCTHSNSNAPLQAGWAASVWSRAGDIIMHTDAGWEDTDMEQFKSMLRDSDEELIEYWKTDQFKVNGQYRETCRDLEYTGYGLALISHVLETLRVQGLDYFATDLGERFRYALGFHAQFEDQRNPVEVPTWLCGGTLDLKLGTITEVGSNALHNRLCVEMSHTKNFTEDQRSFKNNNGLFVAFETLTHAQNPWP